eukprot:gene52007-30649_t
MGEVTLIHWSDAVNSFTDFERFRNKEVVEIIARERCHHGQCYPGSSLAMAEGLDPVTRVGVKHDSGPMHRLPGCADGGRTVNGTASDGRTCLAIAAALPDN